VESLWPGTVGSRHPPQSMLRLLLCARSLAHMGSLEFSNHLPHRSRCIAVAPRGYEMRMAKALVALRWSRMSTASVRAARNVRNIWQEKWVSHAGTKAKRLIGHHCGDMESLMSRRDDLLIDLYFAPPPMAGRFSSQPPKDAGSIIISNG